jgi:Mg-chelatase subunit ChlD
MNILDVVIRTRGSLAGAQMGALRALGLCLVGIAGNHAFRWRGTSPASLADLQALEFVAEVTEITPARRLVDTYPGVGDAPAAAAYGSAAVARTRTNELVGLDRPAEMQMALPALDQVEQALTGTSALPTQLRQDCTLVVAGPDYSPKPLEFRQAICQAVCHVIDCSGSMDYYGYMEPVRERARQLVDMLRIDDLTGAVTCNRLAAPVYPLTAITGWPVKTAARAAIDALDTGGATSIGGGLKLAADELATANPAHRQAVVLLSDGHEDTAPWVGGGVADSPPAWYFGPDLTEILPTVPPQVKIFTVSLGVQSDEVLLQELARISGGVFHAIHGPSEIGQLHEIYLHLQAMAGGEEVLACGNDAVGNAGSAGNAHADAVISRRRRAAPAPVLRGNGHRSSVPAGLIEVGATNPAGEGRETAVRRHVVPVDDTVTSLTLMVSWHDPEAPVSLSVVSPSLRVYDPGDPQIQNMAGSSYQFYRIANPEPGRWTLVVTPAWNDHSGCRAYTWGAYGATPIGIEWQLPRQIVGLAKVEVCVGLRAEPAATSGVKLAGTASLAGAAVNDMVRRYRGYLDECRLPFKPDTPVSRPDAFKLGLLDQKYTLAGRPSIFPIVTQGLRLSRATGYADTLVLPAPAAHTVVITAQGKTRAGLPFSRAARFSLRN